MRWLAALLLITGCGGGAPPAADELYGLWANTGDDGTVRVLDFDETGAAPDLAGLTDVYSIHMYAAGTAPVEVQRGTFEILEGDGWELVTTVTADQDGSTVGQSFGNPILDFDGDTLTLETGDGGERVYAATDAMP